MVRAPEFDVAEAEEQVLSNWVSKNQAKTIGVVRKLATKTWVVSLSNMATSKVIRRSTWKTRVSLTLTTRMGDFKLKMWVDPLITGSWSMVFPNEKWHVLTAWGPFVRLVSSGNSWGSPSCLVNKHDKCTILVFFFELYNSDISHDGSIVLVYMLTWMGYIDGIHVTIYSSTMDLMGIVASTGAYSHLNPASFPAGSSWASSFGAFVRDSMAVLSRRIPMGPMEHGKTTWTKSWKEHHLPWVMKCPHWTSPNH